MNTAPCSLQRQRKYVDMNVYYIFKVFYCTLHLCLSHIFIFLFLFSLCMDLAAVFAWHSLSANLVPRAAPAPAFFFFLCIFLFIQPEFLFQTLSFSNFFQHSLSHHSDLRLQFTSPVIRTPPSLTRRPLCRVFVFRGPTTYRPPRPEGEPVGRQTSARPQNTWRPRWAGETFLKSGATWIVFSVSGEIMEKTQRCFLPS